LSRETGCRVLCFDLYGHGLSNAPKVELSPCGSCSTPCCGPRGRYNLDFFVEQADELLQYIGAGESLVNVAGFSLGGAIAVAFAERFPNRVMRLIAMSPAGFLPKKPKAYYLLKCLWCCLVPLAPHVVCTCWYKRERFMKSLKTDEGFEEADADNLWRKFVWQLFVKRGVASATLAVLHRVPWFSLRPLFCRAGSHPRPVLLIWGELDTLNPLAVGEEVKRCFCNAQLVVVKNAGHIAMYDQQRQVVQTMAAFLKLPPETSVDRVVFPLSMRFPLSAEGSGRFQCQSPRTHLSWTETSDDEGTSQFSMSMSMPETQSIASSHRSSLPTEVCRSFKVNYEDQMPLGPIPTLFGFTSSRAESDSTCTVPSLEWDTVCSSAPSLSDPGDEY